MKKTCLISLLVVLSLQIWSQKQIKQYEYWFDDAFTTKKTINITPSVSYGLATSIPTTDLPTGLHTYQIRFQDSSGAWSATTTQFFVKPPSSISEDNKITKYEYWFDNNYSGKATQNVTAQSDLSLVTDIAAASLPAGLHTFQIRFQSASGKWSATSTQFFVKQPSSISEDNKITKYEYWFDNNYSGKAIQNVTAQTDLSLVTDIAAASLPAGLHTFQIRFQSASGKWSSTTTQFFVKPPSSVSEDNKITKYEYWFDNNYTRKATQNVTAQTDLSLVTDIAAESLPAGLHTFQIRFQSASGKWSSTTTQFFVKQPSSISEDNKITKYEYWFDNNYSGKATQNVTAQTDLSLVTDIATESLPAGMHTLQIRFQSASGKWTVPTVHIFLKPEATQQTPASITRYRYWFNNDFAHRTDVTVDPVNPLNINNLSIPVEKINKITPNNYSFKIDSIGGNKIVYHPSQLFNIQFKDSRNRWSSTSIDTIRCNYEVDLMCDTLLSKVAKQVVLPTTDTLHIYKTEVLAGDSLDLMFGLMFWMPPMHGDNIYILDLYDPNGEKIKSVSNKFDIKTGVRAKTDGIYYIALHGFKGVYWDYMLHYKRIDRILPNLHVQSVAAQDAVANTKTSISWTVKNDGTATTGTSIWRDRIWLVKDITKDFSTTGVLLYDTQNLKSLAVGESYQNSAEITIPERYVGKYYVVVMSDMNDVTSINWTPAGGTVPETYSPSISGIPYPYLNAMFNASYNKVLELSEKSNHSDNFFYKAINITLPPLADLQVTSIDLPESMFAERKATVNVTITNYGIVDIAANKSFVNRLYWSKDATFNKNTVHLLASQTYSGGLNKNASHNIQFKFNAPSDSINQIRFFVETDVFDSIFELNKENNILNSNWLKLSANTIISSDYAILKNFFTNAGGAAWSTKWNTASNVINATNWYGVSFNEGYVTSIALPSNNIRATFPLSLGSLDSLTTLQLNGNKLYGEIPTFTNQFRALKNLDLSYNNFSSIASTIPASVSNLNLSYQNYLVDSLYLSVSPTIIMPQILKYNHAEQAFTTKPTFVIYDGNNPVGNMWYNNDNEPKMYFNNINYWQYKSGKEFTFTQTNGSTYGSTAILKIYFTNGDANMDKQISILDVQHTLNYLLGEPAIPFNFSAADTFCDTIITVQDIVSTVNILLNEVPPAGPPEDPENILRKIKASDFSPATIYIADNKLMLNTTVPVAAFDVTLSGLTESQLQHQLADYGFSVITRKQKDGSIRFVAFSVNGNLIPTGESLLANLNNKNVEVKKAVLSNKQAKEIAVELSQNITTRILNKHSDDFDISSNEAKIFLQISSSFEIVDVFVYNTQGIEVAQRNLKSPKADLYELDFTSDIRTKGVYLIQIVAKSNNKISTLNYKIIVSK